MADKGLVHGKINALPSDLRPPLNDAFDETLDNLRVGTEDRALNMRWYRVSGTTHATANTEFSIKHGLGFTPSQAFPVLDLSVVNSVMPVLTVTRAADDARIYLSSPSTAATFTILLE